MRVLTLLPGHDFGGAERAAAAICAGLTAAGDAVLVGAGAPLPEPLREGLTTAVLPISPAEKAAALRGALDVARLARGFRADVIYTHHRWPTLLARPARMRYGVPIVFHCHALLSRRRLCYWGDWTIAVAVAVADQVKSLGARTESTSVIRVAATERSVERSTARAVRMHVRSRIGKSDGRFALVVSRLVKEKNVEAVLRIVAQTDISLVIIGDGPDRSRLEQVAAGLGVGDRILFLGWLADPGPFFAAADFSLVVSPSEGVPLAALESMRLSCPVIATDVGGLSELISSGDDGMLVAPGDEAALLQAVTSVVSDEARRRQMGAQAATTAARYANTASMISQVREVLTRVAHES